MLSLNDIEMLFARFGAEQYSGEPVTQLEHALQTAHLAEQSGADDALVTACLLHDLGHLLNRQGDTPSLRGIDDTHQYFALPFLRGLFPDAVLDAIRLHVDAKRYLCQANAGYHARLSDDSRRSLALQGGVFDAAQATAFLAQNGAHDAVLLRQWDDLAKQAEFATPSLAHFLGRAVRCTLPSVVQTAGA
jgi:phosphonate degradation associated HDIG domain protein